MARAWEIVEAMHWLLQKADALQDDAMGNRFCVQFSPKYTPEMHMERGKKLQARAKRHRNAAYKLEAKLRNSRLVWR